MRKPDGYTVKVGPAQYLGRMEFMGPLVVVPYNQATVFTTLEAANKAANTYGPAATIHDYYLGDARG